MTTPGSPLARRAWPLRGDLALLFALALLVVGLAARLITHPGYVDAYYYFAGALQLARGMGFTEPYQWNYLAAGQPGVGVTPPWPSHLYWMPLTSILAAPAIALAERVAGGTLPNATLFRAAQWPSILLAGFLPFLSYAVARRLSGQRRHALAAALLTLFSPFYFVYWPNTDGFALHALAAAGALCAAALSAASSPTGRQPAWAFAAGLGAGLAHLTRADGVLVLLVVLGWLAWPRAPGRVPRLMPLMLLVLAGYLLIMAPWFWRNWLIIGRPLAAGGTQTLWLRDYNELFNYPAGRLTPAHYFSEGWAAILQGKWQALQDNATTLAVVQGGVVGFPFALAGLWQCRRAPIVQVSVLYGMALFALMTFAFSLPGARGGYFHSGAALLPVLTAVTLVGLDATVDAASRRLPHWQPHRSKPVFSMLLVLSTVVLTFTVYWLRVVGPDPQQPAWSRQDAAYAEAGAWLADIGAADGLAVTNNPPGWYYWTGQTTIVIPNAETPGLLRAMDDYDARWLLLDQNYPAGLAGLYLDPHSEPRLSLRATFGQADAPVYLFERVPLP